MRYSWKPGSFEPGHFLHTLTGAALLALGGCRAVAPLPAEGFASRILAPPEAVTTLPPLPEPGSASDTIQEPTLPPPRRVDDPGSAKGTGDTPPEAKPPAAETFSLDEAIAFGLRNNPRLRMARAAIDQARGQQQVAFAPFLPHLSSLNRVLTAESVLTNVRSTTEPVVGFGNSHQEFSQTELYLQWMIYDFGRTHGRYAQASLRVDIAALQSSRADQTVAYEVSSAYYRLRYARATRIVARQAVRRAESILELTRNLFNNGVVDRDSVLRAEVQLADVSQFRVSAESGEHIAQSALNFAMGRNASSPIEAAPLGDEPRFQMALTDALGQAVANRRELQVAGRSVEVANEGVRVARAAFKPRVYLHGQFDYVAGGGVQVGNTEMGAIHLDWGIYEGGKRVGETRAAGAAVQAAVAQAQVVADTIAYEVNQAYWSVEDARQRIQLARTSITQASENLRLVVNKYKAGDATPTDVVDAETALTRSQQSLNTALSDYLTALARLDYAMGTTPDSAAIDQLPPRAGRPQPCPPEENLPSLLPGEAGGVEPVPPMEHP